MFPPSSPLPFTPPTPADASLVRRCTEGACSSDLAAANLVLLQGKYHTTVAQAEGMLFRHYEQNARLLGYAFPAGARDAEGARRGLELIRGDAAARGRELRFCLLTAEQRSFLEEWSSGEFIYTTDRGDADYLYRRELLADLPGTPYHAKRNHISRFTRDFPVWSTRQLCRDNPADALGIAEAWLAAQEEDTPALHHELNAISRALELLEPLQLFGLLLYVESQPAAMAIASFISDQVVDIHYEKCAPAFRGAYALINREFARSRPVSCTLINREEDLNTPGLRQAKLSYHPSLILEKFSARPCTATAFERSSSIEKNALID